MTSTATTTTPAKKTRRTRVSIKDVDTVRSGMLRECMLFSVAEAAAVLNYSDRKVFNLIRDGKLKAAADNPGRSGIRITGHSLKEYIAAITIAPEYWQR